MFFGKPLATRLAEAAKVNGSPLQQSYRNTIYCNATLSQSGGKLTGTYCGNRWCPTCARIRTALAITRYMPVLKTWRDVQFVTLTVRNVPADRLQQCLGELMAGFTAAKRAIKRTDKTAFRAVRKLECTYNIGTDEYHPHFHVYVEGKRAAERLVARWLEHFPDTTDAKAQDIQPVAAGDDEALLELFKYFTKLITKKTVIPATALDVIFRAMRGRRVYQPVGFVVDAADDEAELELDKGTAALTRPAESITWEWNQQAADWVDVETGECLTGYEPTERFRGLVDGMKDPGEHAPRLLARVDVGTPEEQLERMRRRLRSAELANLERSPEQVSTALERIFGMSRARAQAMAARVLPDDQIGLAL